LRRFQWEWMFLGSGLSDMSDAHLTVICYDGMMALWTVVVEIGEAH